MLEVEGVAPEGTVGADIGLYFNDPTGVGWWDDATLEAEIEREEIVREPISDVTPLEGGARGMAATIGAERIAVITSGDAIDIGGATVMHDGRFAAVSLTEGGWNSIYLQDGMQVLIDGRPILTLEQPATIAVWRDDAGEVRAKVHTSLAPHAEAAEAEFVLGDAQR